MEAAPDRLAPASTMAGLHFIADAALCPADSVVVEDQGLALRSKLVRPMLSYGVPWKPIFGQPGRFCLGRCPRQSSCDSGTARPIDLRLSRSRELRPLPHRMVILLD